MKTSACLRTHKSTRKLLEKTLRNATEGGRFVAVAQLLSVRALYVLLLSPQPSCTRPIDKGWWKQIWRACKGTGCLSANPKASMNASTPA